MERGREGGRVREKEMEGDEEVAVIQEREV